MKEQNSGYGQNSNKRTPGQPVAGTGPQPAKAAGPAAMGPLP